MYFVLFVFSQMQQLTNGYKQVFVLHLQLMMSNKSHNHHPVQLRIHSKTIQEHGELTPKKGLRCEISIYAIKIICLKNKKNTYRSDNSRHLSQSPYRRVPRHVIFDVQIVFNSATIIHATLTYRTRPRISLTSRSGEGTCSERVLQSKILFSFINNP